MHEKLKQAVRDANVGADAKFAFEEKEAAVAQTRIPQLHITYESGNEYLNLKTLLASLRTIGDVTVFEFRGRGSNETPTLVADVSDGERTFQLIYHLPS